MAETQHIAHRKTAVPSCAMIRALKTQRMRVVSSLTSLWFSLSFRLKTTVVRTMLKVTQTAVLLICASCGTRLLSLPHHVPRSEASDYADIDTQNRGRLLGLKGKLELVRRVGGTVQSGGDDGRLFFIVATNSGRNKSGHIAF